MVCLIIKCFVGLLLVALSLDCVLGDNYTGETETATKTTTTKANFKAHTDDYADEEGWTSKRQIALTKLEEYLVKNVKTDDPDKNLNQVLSKHSWLSCNVFKSKEKKQLWMEYALEPFVKLANANECDKQALKELNRFAYFLHLRKERAKSDVRTRLVSLVQHYGARLADICEHTYPDKLKQALSTRKPEKMELLYKILDQELVDWMKSEHHDWIASAIDQDTSYLGDLEWPLGLAEKIKGRLYGLRKEDPEYEKASHLFEHWNEYQEKHNKRYWEPMSEKRIEFEKISFLLNKYLSDPCTELGHGMHNVFSGEIHLLRQFNRHNKNLFYRQPNKAQDIITRHMICKNRRIHLMASQMVPDW